MRKLRFNFMIVLNGGVKRRPSKTQLYGQRQGYYYLPILFIWPLRTFP